LHLTSGLREGGAFRTIMKEMGVFDELKIRYLNDVFIMKFPDFEIAMPASASLFRDNLVKLFPEQKDCIDKLFATMKRLYEETLAAMGGVRDIRPAKQELAHDALAAEYPTTAKYMTASIEELVMEHVQDPKLASTIYPFCLAFGVKPKRFPAIVYVMLL